MKIVLDTNVLMSGIFFGGIPGRILEAWKAGKVILVVSADIFEEYVQVGERLLDRYGGLDLSPILALLAQKAEAVEAPELEERVSDDSDDDKFLACALAAGASFLVSGDHDLLSVSAWRGITVCSPREFVDDHLSTGDE